MAEATQAVLAAIDFERKRQDVKWGNLPHLPDGTGDQVWSELATMAKQVCDEAAKTKTVTWTDIFLEEVYEALAETDMDKVVGELVQVAAVVSRWIEDLAERMQVPVVHLLPETTVPDLRVAGLERHRPEARRQAGPHFRL